MDNKVSKIKFIYVNTITVLITQVINIILGFVVRKTFVVKLGVIYLGYNSVFSNILSMLSLTELGVGVAIASFLYKPIADNDTERIKVLMYIFKKIYRILGIIIAVMGILVSFLLPIFISDAGDDFSYLRLLFYINLAGSVSTYYMGYQRTLLIADQRTYVTSMIDTVLYLIASITQIVILFIIPNYVIYVCITIGKNVLSNLIVYFNCSKKYDYLNSEIDYSIIGEYKIKIKKYVKDVFISKIGAYVFYSTDNLIISAFKGSILTGFLSNYTMITNIVSNIVGQALASIQATFGIYINSETDIQNQKNMVNNYLFANYFIGNFCMICIMFLIQPFIKIYFGDKFLLDNSTAALLGINLLFSILIQLPAQLFVIYGLFKYDKLIILISASLNIAISIALINRIGIDGALIGTVVTSLIYLYSRLVIVSKKVYSCSPMIYFKKLSYYYVVSMVTVLLVKCATSWITKVTLNIFVIKIFIVGILAIIVPVLLLSKTQELDFLIKKLFLDKTKKVIEKIKLKNVSAEK